MYHVQLPLTPAARARLTRQSYARMRARMLGIRARRVGVAFPVVSNQKRTTGSPAVEATNVKGGGLPTQLITAPTESIMLPERSKS